MTSAIRTLVIMSAPAVVGDDALFTERRHHVVVLLQALTHIDEADGVSLRVCLEEALAAQVAVEDLDARSQLRLLAASTHLLGEHDVQFLSTSLPTTDRGCQFPWRSAWFPSRRFAGTRNHGR